jgi:hypothetical protein
MMPKPLSVVAGYADRISKVRYSSGALRSDRRTAAIAISRARRPGSSGVSVGQSEFWDETGVSEPINVSRMNHAVNRP